MEVEAISDVLIVGAGPAGLATALLLASHGVIPRIVESKTDHSERTETEKMASKALAVHSRTLELMNFAGLMDQFLEEGLMLKGLNNATGGPIVHFDETSLQTPFPFALSIPQFQTESILLKKCVSLGIKVEWNTKVSNIEQDEEKVTVSVVNTKDGESVTQKIFAKYVVGADGSHSSVRHATNIKFSGEDVNRSLAAMDCKVKCDTINPSGKTNNGRFYFFPGERPEALLSMPNDRFRYVLEIDNLKVNEEVDVTFFQKLMEERHPELKLEFYDPTWITKFTVRQRLADHFRENRIFLVGDAAHSHSPIGGQGMNTGIQDGYNLGWKLACVLKGKAKHPDKLLDSYETERWAVANRLVNATGSNAFSNVGSAVQILPILETVFSTLPALNNMVFYRLGMLDINYRKSPLSVEHTPSMINLALYSPSKAASQVAGLNLCAGDRAPDGKVSVLDEERKPGQETNLFTVLRKYFSSHVLLVFLESHKSSGVIEELEKIIDLATKVEIQTLLILPSINHVPKLNGKAEYLLDVSGELRQSYCLFNNQLVYIRPDSWVGYLGDLHYNQFKEYLENIFLF